MAAPQSAVTTHPAYRMQVAVLRVTLFAKPGGIVPTPRAPFTVAATGALGPLGIFICNCYQRITYQIESCATMLG